MKTLDDIRRFAVSRSLFPSTTLARAIDALGFLQADPIRAPARAQDLTLRHRVRGYRAGDLDRLYPSLPVEEDVFINYGFVTRPLQALMHPRTGAALSPTAANKRAAAVLAFVRERGTVHPREVTTHFSHGTVTNYWGGSSSATTHLLEALHYKGLLRVARREGGIRIYAPACARTDSRELRRGLAAALRGDGEQHGPGPIGAVALRSRVDALVDLVVRKYAPLPAASLTTVVSRLRYAVPQWRGELRRALQRAKQRLSHAQIDGHIWYWPAEEKLPPDDPPAVVRLLAPFDPVVWDRRRFELLWGWAYRFEAYTPLSKRKLGYYALPLLWRDRVVGWGNVSAADGVLRAELGYVKGRPPRERAFTRELEAELDRMREFLALPLR